VAAAAPDLLGADLPLVAAPMAGGPTTVALARAVAGAGAFPFLAGAYRTPDALAAEVAHLRATGRPVRGEPVSLRTTRTSTRPRCGGTPATCSRWPTGTASTCRPPVLVEDDDGWRDKLDVLLADPVPVVSVTFGPARAGRGSPRCAARGPACSSR
jgi:NAD(P)H-dependent flavin oxidoreductase YrpB (nitropropane dioxygenase family)